MLRNTLMALAAASVSLTAMGAASAADLAARPIYKAAPASVAPAWSWSGLYVGVHGGYGGDRTEYPFSVGGGAAAGSLSVTSGGGFAGGQIGYNWQTGPMVFGIEADIAWSGIRSEVAGNIGGFGASAGTDLEWFGTIRGRLGYAWDRALLYATGGFAYGETKTRVNFLGTNIFTQSNDKTGWTVGAGLEYALAPGWSFKTEYLYLDLGSDTVAAGALLGGSSISEDTRIHTVKAGVNWKFGRM